MPNGNPGNTREALLILQERVAYLQATIERNEALALERVERILAANREDMAGIKRSIELLGHNSVTMKEFLPIKNLVFGFVGLVLVTVIGAIVALVVLP